MPDPFVWWRSNTRLQHELRTPTFALTTIGYLALGIYALRGPNGGSHGSDIAAFVCLGLTAGGIAMALDAECRRKGEEWSWAGLHRTFRKRPTKEFVIAFAAHLPQMITAAWIAITWRRGRRRV